MRERRHITVQGIVQGVGFRPFVYRLAQQYGLVGYALNDSTGVRIEVEGEAASVEAFWRAVQNKPPPLALIERVAWEIIPLNGDSAFVIAPSHGEAEKQVFISPDVCICKDCLHELFDPTNRRYCYPFINCTNCGPRFTLIRDVPYDRHQTTMAVFKMCPTCQQEYDDPSDRRFHAQPNACSECGPQVSLILPPSPNGRGTEGEDITGNLALIEAHRLLAAGAILAIKGLGGYHLACDALNFQAVATLRARKHREDKPFALMARDLDTIEQFCWVDEVERAALTSYQRPIVLLRRRPSTLAPEVAPNQRYLGFMLPYTPLHHLLLSEATPVLVMTSGNLSDEPIAYQDDVALERLTTITDAFLTHNREIHVRCDDSVIRRLPAVAGQASGSMQFIRRSRGYTPQPISLAFEFPQPVLAVGAQLKNTFCLGKGAYAFMSHHIGDLENLETLTSFTEGIAHFQRLFDMPSEPAFIAHDLHPTYLSTQWAQGQQSSRGIEEKVHPCVLIPVQHHHAHIASVLAEHRVTGPVLGVAFDGTGYGADGHIWGGEFLLADLTQYTRLAHLAYIPMPGGEAAIRQPWRMAAAYLEPIYGSRVFDLDLPLVQQVDQAKWQVLRQMLARKVNCPLTSSMGRLFDAVAALTGVRHEVNYEGQAGLELEMLADESCPESYNFAWAITQQPYQIDPQPVIAAIIADLQQRVPAAIISTKFHNAVAQLIADVCVQFRAETGLNQVALSGGVFQNMYLLTRACQTLTTSGFAIYLNQKVPANDGGLALGQAAIAATQVGQILLAKEE